MDYLFNRRQVVQLGNDKSQIFNLNSGVQQLKILCLLLFVIFFDYVVNCLDKANIKYADDTVIYFSDTNFLIIENTLQNALENLLKYFHENELVINLKKGKT